MKLPDEEVTARFNEFVEAWELHEVAQSELQKFEASTGQPMARGHSFEDIESFIEFNRKRREYVKQREALILNRDGSAERLKEIGSVIQVLLPRDCSLTHNHAGIRYVIENTRGQAIVRYRSGAPE